MKKLVLTLGFRQFLPQWESPQKVSPLRSQWLMAKPFSEKKPIKRRSWSRVWKQSLQSLYHLIKLSHYFWLFFFKPQLIIALRAFFFWYWFSRQSFVPKILSKTQGAGLSQEARANLINTSEAGSNGGLITNKYICSHSSSRERSFFQVARSTNQ